MYVRIMQRTGQCKPRIEIHVSRFLERCIYADSDNPYQFKGSDSCVLAQMYLPLSNSGNRIASSRYPRSGIGSGIRSSGLMAYATTHTASALVYHGVRG